MTLAPHRSPAFQFNALLAVVVLDLVLAVVALSAFGAGPAFFLFALAAVGIVQLVLLRRRRGAQAPRG